MKRLVPLAAALVLGLAACGDSTDEEEVTYETDVVDESGGDLIVRDADEPGVEVDVPDTPMTNVPSGGETGTTTTDAQTGQTTPPAE